MYQYPLLATLNVQVIPYEYYKSRKTSAFWNKKMLKYERQQFRHMPGVSSIVDWPQAISKTAVAPFTNME